MPDLRDFKASLARSGPLIGYADSTVSSGACVATVGGIQTTVRVVTGLTVAVGDRLIIQRVASTYVATNVLPAAPAVPPPTPTPQEEAPDTGDAAPAPKPVTTTGTLTVTPVATATYRDGKWRTDIGSVNSADTFQGRYSGSSYGRNTGVAFYGSKPRSLSGATVTKATIRVKRLAAGDFAARTATLRLVTQATRPSGAPTLNETTSGPSLKVNTSGTFTIPDAWAQAIVNGTRGGIAISISSDSPYIQFAGRNSWSAAWTLTIYWRRSS
ncbi:uncharacterized protein SGFS_012830 [Streptomyces graminofaciens]|uniref:Minor tail protein n=1 Tax=Streptomyces graminofaciens TaxID=68212 RepID=A0ABM7F2M9_9ACTN|nr:hypothetical protein [Streptomyces graminofaciens]BBC29989.1 uncharacterized protein SGFS_012830 [Streptomyces graminofaciens]